VAYAKEVIKDQVVAGLHDSFIKMVVLIQELMNKWTLLDLISFVELKEAGRVSARLLGGHNIAGEVSSKPCSKPQAEERRGAKERRSRKQKGKLVISMVNNIMGTSLALLSQLAVKCKAL
jgi:hypothetical protein